MPQFDLSFYTSQIFWMLISFGLLFMWISFIIFPMFDDIFEARKTVIQKHLRQAEKINKEAETLIQQVQEQRLHAEKKRAQALGDARLKAQDDMQLALTKNGQQCNTKFKHTIAKLETVESTLRSAVNDWTHQTQKALVAKIKPKRGVKCKS